MERPHELMDWLVERLSRSEQVRYPVVWCSATPRRLGPRSWESDQGLTDLQPVVERLLQDLRVGMRIVFVTDLDLEDPSARAFGAIALARILAERGKRVLLVDADLGVPGADRLIVAEGEEGLFDMITAGASISRVMRAGPAANLWKMGIGSYRPASAAALSHEEMRRTVSMFKGAFDVTLVCAAAWDGGEKFHPLIVHSDRVIPCFYLQRSLGFSLDELTNYLNRQGVPLAGMIAFSATEDVGRAGAVPAKTARAAAPGARAEPALAAEADEIDGDEFDEEEGSSPVFRWGVGIVGFLFLAFLGWWGWVSLGPGDGQNLQQRELVRQQPTPVPEETPNGSRVVSERDAESRQTESDSLSLAGLASERDVEVDVPFQEPGEAVESESPPSERDVSAAAGVQAELGDTQAEPETDELGEEVAPLGADTSQALPEQEAEPSMADARWEGLRQYPGSGYALHLWSFPDSIEAAASAVGLQREGLGTRVVAVDLGERGRWYRVVVGRFSAKADAMAARELLAVRKDVDFVGVVPVR